MSSVAYSMLSTKSGSFPERFPVRSKLHGGWKGFVYNHLFVDPFNWLPRSLVRRFGWHLMAFCRP